MSHGKKRKIIYIKYESWRNQTCYILYDMILYILYNIRQGIYNMLIIYIYIYTHSLGVIITLNMQLLSYIFIYFWRLTWSEMIS